MKTNTFILTLLLMVTSCFGVKPVVQDPVVDHEPKIDVVVIDTSQIVINEYVCGFDDDAAAYTAYECTYNDYRKIKVAIENYVPTLEKDRFDSILNHALQVVETIVDIDFCIVSRYEDPVIRFSGYRKGVHANSSEFDGPGNVLAHAHWPCFYDCERVGRVNYDFDEDWTFGWEPGKINILKVTIHELFHALGLKHNATDEESIMYPGYIHGPITITYDDYLFFFENYNCKITKDEIKDLPYYVDGNRRQ